MATAGKLKDLAADITAAVAAEQAKITALQTQTGALRSIKKEMEDWITENQPKYIRMKAEMEDMKRQARELVEGMERAGV